MPSSLSQPIATAAPPTSEQRALDGIAIRRMPYPWRSMLAICSDLDETPDLRTYLETLKYLNTQEQTLLGRGVGMEVGNSLYFDMAPGELSYWNVNDSGRAQLRSLIRSGHIDCLHSYGDLATTRRHAGRALDELSYHGCALGVWVDHAVAPSNFGADIMRGSGDVTGSPVFHADLTCAYGIDYVWRGRVTSVIGQNVQRRLSGIFEPAAPIASLKTLGKELTKGLFPGLDGGKYAMHAPNALMRPERLRSGHAVTEFMRSNPCWRGVGKGATAFELAEALTPRMLDGLVAREAVSIFYTHLGKIASVSEPFPPATRAALEYLAQRHHDGHLLVTTTHRLLRYWTVADALTVSGTDNGGWDRVDLRTSPDTRAGRDGDLDGVTIYVRDAARTRLFVDGEERRLLNRNPPDHTGRPSLSLPWRRLELPPV